MDNKLWIIHIEGAPETIFIMDAGGLDDMGIDFASLMTAGQLRDLDPGIKATIEAELCRPRQQVERVVCVSVHAGHAHRLPLGYEMVRND